MGKEEKERRKHLFKHKTYLESIANRIATTLPTEAEIYNTLRSMYSVIWDEGYSTRIDDSIFFKAKREQHRKNSFGMVKNHIDDIIHSKETKQRINQPKK